jgi:hypothetical protein
MLEAIIEGFLIDAICLYCFTYVTGDPDNGKMNGLWTVGVLIYSLVVVFANLKVLQICYVHYWFSVLIIVLSIASYYLCSVIITDWIFISNVFGNYDGRGSTSKMLGNPTSYLITAAMIMFYY